MMEVLLFQCETNGDGEREWYAEIWLEIPYMII